ncbi:MAG: LysR family transcriptional regulator [Chloroflexi bacterium]|nr:LysR family transcriptional regulator [Chloroflexota bacterium]
MLLAQIEAFVAVARHGHLGRAAEALFVSQPTVTLRIKGLERTLKDQLFIRSARGMRLTEAGKAFLPHAERALHTLRQGRTAIESVRSGRGGRLVVGATPAVSTYVLPNLLARFTAEHPEIEIVVRTGHSEQVLEMILADQVQLGLMRLIQHPDLAVTRLYEDELVLVVPPGHALCTGRPMPVAALADQRLILFDHTSSYYEVTHALFATAGVRPRSVMELDNIEAAKKMVECRLGIALLPRAAVAREVAAGLLIALPLVDAPPLRRAIVAARRAAEPLSPIVRSFLTMATAHVAGAADGGR